MKETVKEIMEKYNNAFGYIKGFFVALGFMALIFVVATLVDLSSKSISETKGLTYLITDTILFVIAVIIVWHTWTKCPPNHRGIIGLAFSMAFVGSVGLVSCWWGVVSFVFSLSGSSGTESVGSGSESEGSQKLAYSYYRESDGEPCTLYSSLNENFATLRDSHGNSISVYRDGSTEFLRDDSGNYYRPN